MPASLTCITNFDASQIQDAWNLGARMSAYEDPSVARHLWQSYTRPAVSIFITLFDAS
jgi:hypothetical protein